MASAIFLNETPRLIVETYAGKGSGLGAAFVAVGDRQGRFVGAGIGRREYHLNDAAGVGIDGWRAVVALGKSIIRRSNGNGCKRNRGRAIVIQRDAHR